MPLHFSYKMVYSNAMRWFQVGVALFLFMAQALQAAEPPPKAAQYLKIYWSGFHVASLVFGYEPAPNGEVLARAVIRTYGLAKSVSRYQSDSLSLSEAGVPLKFKTSFSHRKSAREIVLNWKDFVLISEHNQPPEKPGKRTKVSKAQKDGAYDPLTAFFAARAKVMAGEKKFSVPMYDGRRRSELQFEVLETRKDGTLHVTLREIFLAGYTGREQEERAQRDITIHINVDPVTLLPVGGIAESVIGEATARLGGSCERIVECMAKAELE